MEIIFEISNRLLSQLKTEFTRSLFHHIDWSQRLIEIRGSRGVGKTTLMLQKTKSLNKNGYKALYVSLDLPHFYRQSLYDFTDNYVKYGGEYLFLDEVHRYPAKYKDSDWSMELKNIYDSFPELKIVYSGSSILHLFQGRGDLSRRKASYLLNGLSFREYLELNKFIKIESLSLDSLITDHQKIAENLLLNFRPLPHLKNYLKTGYYPFYKGNENIYFKQLQDVVNLTIDTDLPYLSSITSSAREQLKRLLGALSTTVPYIPNMSNLAELVHVADQRTLLKYLNLLNEAQLISLVRSSSKGNKILQKPEKILIDNSNLMYALGMNMNETGTIRETFFYNQLSNVASVAFSDKADFLVDNKYIFEVGGKNKGKKQIQDLSNAFIVVDETEIGFGNKIPLWLFGLLY